jgi:hypothetical protein
MVAWYATMLPTRVNSRNTGRPSLGREQRHRPTPKLLLEEWSSTERAAYTRLQAADSSGRPSFGCGWGPRSDQARSVCLPDARLQPVCHAPGAVEGNGKKDVRCLRTAICNLTKLGMLNIQRGGTIQAFGSRVDRGSFYATEEREIVTKLTDAIVSIKEQNSPSWLVDLEALWSAHNRGGDVNSLWFHRSIWK